MRCNFGTEGFVKHTEWVNTGLSQLQEAYIVAGYYR
jgi:hypothetical protein